MLPSYDDIFDIGEREILLGNSDIDPAQIRREGSRAWMTVSNPAAMCDQLARQVEIELTGMMLSTAKGERLENVAADRYAGLTKYGSTASRGHITFYRNDTSLGDLSLDSGLSIMDRSGKRYSTVDSGVISGELPVNIRAVSGYTGEVSNAKAGVINRIMTKLSDKNIKCTNAAALAKFVRADGTLAGKIPAETILTDNYGNNWLTLDVLEFKAGQLYGYVPLMPQGAHGYVSVAVENSINTIKSGQELFDSFTVSNPVKCGGAFAGGDDKETDGHFLERCYRFFESIQRGNDAALIFGALSVAGVRHVQVFPDTENGYSALAMHMIIADVNGIGNDALISEVETALADYKAGGIHVFVSGGQIEQLDWTARMAIEESFDADVVKTIAANIIKEYNNSLAPSSGEYNVKNKGIVQISEVVRRLKQIDGVFVPSDGVSLPDGDYVPVKGNSARSGTITVNIERLSL